MAGDWSRVAVVSAVTEDPTFYPMSDHLSFTVQNNELTIGRNEICDAYVMLTGVLNDKAIGGQYYDLSLGGISPRGFFTLNRVQ